MSEQERIRLLLDVQEHPENYSDEQLNRLLEDEELAALFEEVALTKRALVRQGLGPSPAVTRRSFISFRHPLFKVAASVVGVFVVSGIAFAAIYSLTPSPSPKGEGSDYIQTSDTIKHSTPPSNRKGAGSEATIIYDNIPLEKMLPEIAAHYGAEVVFANDDVRGLRFRFVWNQLRGIEQVVSDLNQFERLTVTLKNHQITVE